MNFLDIWAEWSRRSLREENCGKIKQIQEENKMLEINYRSAIEREKAKQKALMQEMKEWDMSSEEKKEEKETEYHEEKNPENFTDEGEA